MTNVTTDQWNKIYKLTSQRTFAINNVNDDYKCGTCKDILVNAHHAICGCHFCYECINQYMANGAINCPNNTENFKSESLSNVVSNHRINKLIVRCTNKMCSHECKLIEMENHLNSCFYKTVKCPFNDVGCVHDDMINDKLNDHMLSDIHNHNKILIDLIGNLRNEMLELKEKVEENRLEIEMLKENDHIKNEKIESLKEEIKLIKQDNENMTQQMEIGDRNLWYKFDEIVIEMKNEYKTNKLMKELDEKIDMKMNARYCDMKEEWNEKFDEKMREENKKIDIERSNKIDKIDKYLNMRDDGRLDWYIGKLNEIEWMMSEYFYDKQNPYGIYLEMEKINDELNISLCIFSGEFDNELKWPCKVDIAINISAINDSWNKSKTVTGSIQIENPDNIMSKCEEPIIIKQSDWTESNLDNINCVLVCRVKFK